MILPVRLFTDPILKQSCLPVIDLIELDKIVEDMLDTMMAYIGVGLAANQIGINKNIAVLNLENKSRLIVLANIKIICYNKETDIQNEACLSCPGVNIPVRRYLGVEVEAQNLSGEKVNYKFNGYDSRILQHEYDHLNGKLITDSLIKI